MVIARIATAALIGCLVAAPVSAEPLHDWYVSLGVGWDHAKRETFEDGSLLEIDRRGWRPNAALGAKFADNWRVELNGSIQENTPEVLYLPSASIEVDPDYRDIMRAKSVMANVIRDIPIGIAWRPYVGAGIGYTDLDYVVSQQQRGNAPRVFSVDDSASGMAFQLITGFTVPITRRLDFAADYRYYKMPSPNLEDVNGADLDIDHTVHSAWVHLRYHAPNAGPFASPPPRRQWTRGLYFELGIGGGFPEDSDVEMPDSSGVISLDAYDMGPTVIAAIGYNWGSRLRFEIEGEFRRNEVERVDFGRFRGEDLADGQVKTRSLMANVIYQFLPGRSVRPFLGIGWGLVHGKFDIDVFGVCQFRVCGAEFSEQHIHDKDTTTGAQALLGVDVVLTQRATFTADYRWSRTKDFKMNSPDGGFYETYLQNVSVTAGVRYALGGKR